MVTRPSIHNWEIVHRSDCVGPEALSIRLKYEKMTLVCLLHVTPGIWRTAIKTARSLGHRSSA